jgi:hypothetical protein
VTSQFVPADFLQLALALRETAVAHNVPADSRVSLIEDVVFQFASFLDERLGSSLHEEIYGLLEQHAEALSQPPRPLDFLVAEVEVVFGKGRRRCINILSGYLQEPRFLRENIEFALGLRSLDELDTEIDSDARFGQLMAKKAGIEMLRFNAGVNIGAPSWVDVPFRESSLDGLCECVRGAIAKWA